MNFIDPDKITNRADGRFGGYDFVINLILFVTAFLFLYHDTLIHMMSAWRTSEGSHGPLIVAVSVYLIWLNRSVLKTLQSQPVVIPGAALTVIGLFTLIAGKLSNTVLLQMLSMIPTLLGVVWLFYGSQFLRILILPIGYIVFLTGFIEKLLSSSAIYFQLVSAWIAAKLLSSGGMPVVLTDTIVAMPHISLEVVRSCSGVNHIVSLMALSVPLAIICNLTPARKLFLLVASFFIGIFANGVRIASIGVYAIYNDGADLHGPNETFYVTFIFFFGMVFLIILSQLLSPKKVTTSRADSSGAMNNDCSDSSVVVMHPSLPSNASGKASTPSVIFGVLFFMTLGFVHFYKIQPVYLHQSVDSFPSELASFSARNLADIDRRLRPFATDEEVLRFYVNFSGKRVDLYFGYHAIQDREHKVIDYRRDWMHEEAQHLSILTSYGTVTINKSRLRDRTNPSDIYFWYIMGDRIITNQYVGKLYTFLDGLLKRRTNGAVVVVQTRSSQEDVMPFLEELVPAVMEFLGSTR